MSDARTDQTIDLLETQLLLRPNDPQKRYLLGNALRNSGRVDEAIASYERAIKAKPDFVDAHYNLGVAHRLNGDYTLALASVDAALARSPKLVDGLRQRAQLLATLHKDEEAVKAYEALLAESPDDEEAPREAGRRRFGKAQYAQAAELLARAAAIEPRRADLMLLLGLSLHRIGKIGEADEALGRYLQLGGKSPVAYAASSDCQAKLGRVDEAIATSRIGLGQFPDDPALHASLGRLLAAKGELDAAVTSLAAAYGATPDEDLALAYVEVLLKLARFRDAAAVCEATAQPNGLPEPLFVPYASALFHAGRLVDAAVVLEDAMKLRSDARACALMGRVCLGLARREDAIEMLSRAEKLGDTSRELAFDLGMLEEELGLPDRALVTYGRVLERDPDDGDALLRAGRVTADAGFDNDAVDLLRRAVKVNPTSALGHRLLGHALERVGRTAEAAEAYRRTFELQSEDVDARLAFARCSRTHNRQDEAIRALRGAAMIAPRRNDILLELARTLSARGLSTEAVTVLDDARRATSDDPAILEQLAIELRLLQRAQEALAHVERALVLRGDDAALLLLRGQIFADIGDDQRARQDLERARLLAPDDPAVGRELGLVAARLGTNHEALELLRTTLRNEPTNVRVALALALALRELGRHEDALGVLAPASAAHPEDADVVFELARLNESCGKDEAAAAGYREAIKLRPDWAVAFEHAARAYARMDMHDDAASALKQLTRIRPEDAEAWFDLGLCHAKLGDHAEAEAAFVRATRFRPDHAATWKNLAGARARLGKVDGEVEALRRVRDLDATDDAALFALAKVYDAQGRAAERRALFEEAAATGDLRVYLELAAIEAQLGKSDAARSWFTRAAERLRAGGLDVAIDPAVVARALAVATAAELPEEAKGAVAELLEAAAGMPGGPAVMSTIAEGLATLGRPEQAVKILARAAGSEDAPMSSHQRLSSLLSGLERHEEAAKALERALEREPSSTATRYALARSYMAQRRAKEALFMLRSVVRVDEKHEGALLALAEICETQGDTRSAVDALARLVRVKPEAASYVRLAKGYERLGKSEERLESLRHAAKLAPSDAAVAQDLGLAYAAAGDERAVDVLERAVLLAPESVAARKELARLLRLRGKSARALVHLEWLGRNAGSDSASALMRAEALAEAGQVREAFEAARAASRAGNREADRLRGQLAAKLRLEGEALEAWKKVLEGNPQDVEAMLELARAHQELGNVAEAVRVLARAAKEAPRRAEPRERLGVALLAQRAFAPARDTLREAVAIAPGHPDAWLWLAEAHDSLGEQRERASALEQYVTLAPRSSTGRQLLGDAYERVGIPDLAERAYLGALERDPGASGVRERLVALFLSRGALAEAAQQQRKLVEAKPTADAWFGLAQLEHEAQDGSSALASIDACLRLEPQRDEARLLRARVLSARGDHVTAKNLLEELFTRHDKDRDVRLLLARAHMACGEQMPAGAHLHAILSRTPEDLEVRVDLAQLYERSGVPAEAVKHYARAYRHGAADAGVMLGWARSLVATGSVAQAEEILEGAATRMPTDARLLEALGRTRLELGNADGARDALTRALAVVRPEAEAEVRYHLGLALFHGQRMDAAQGQVRELERLSAHQLAAHLRTQLRR
jgi:tetratricopeptide (TPR) repeat protein